MEVIKGIPVSPGVVIGRAFILDYADERVPYRTVAETDVPRELQHFENAISGSIADLSELRQRTEVELGTEPSKIFQFHLGLLQDAALIEPIRERIRKEGVTAEYATAEAFRQLAERFRGMGSEVFRHKANDVLDLDHRVLAHLLGQSESRLLELVEPMIVVAHELTPTQTASLDRHKVLGFATDAGGRTSHTSIVARAMDIPAVVGCQHVTLNLNENDMIIVDGDSGLVISRPDDQTLEEYRARQERAATIRVGVREEYAKLQAVTRDGVAITLLGNIEFPDEADTIIEYGADGVGLYRTEFLYLTSRTEPTEEDHFDAYSDCIRRLAGRPLTIRTLDLGADKYTQEQQEEPERNPFLGCRGIRYCLQNLPMFKTQLRAILRASALGPVKIMFPLITTMMELRQAKLVLSDVMEELEEEQIDFRRDLEVGMMVEVPSCALMAKIFAREVDFMSIGTNDLIQYTLAVDRGNQRVANLYSAANPALLSLVKQVIRAGRHHGIETSICGEIAGETLYTMMLLGFGLRTLSLVPSQLPAVKQLIRAVDIDACERLARRVGSFDSERQILHFLREEQRRIIPED